MANPTRRATGSVLRSHSPSGTFHNSSYSNSFASSTTSFSTMSSPFFQNRSMSPTRVNMYGGQSSSLSPSGSLSSVRLFSLDSRPTVTNHATKKPLQTHPKPRMCMCSPTSHPGSFRCSLHKKQNKSNSNSNSNINNSNNTVSYPSNRLNARRSAMTNSLVRIGTVEGGDLVKRALAALIRPSSHQQRRRTSFQPRASRLSVMTKANDL